MNADFIARLELAIEGRESRPEGHEIRFLCPVHNDVNSPSASWHPEKHVWICRTCGAGGGAYGLAKLLTVELPTEDEGLTVEALAEAKRLPAQFLRSLGVSDGVAGIERRRCVDIPYSDVNGELKSVHKRLRLSGDRFRWRKDDSVLPYGLPRLEGARPFGKMFLFEGETDTWTFWLNGLPALGLPGADTWKESFKRYLDGFNEVYAWREPGQGGDTFVSKIASDLPDILVITPPLGIKDVNELWLVSGLDKDTFLERLRPLVEAARPASAIRSEALSEEARRAAEAAAPLLADPNLLDHVKAAIRQSGYAGNLTPPLLVYIGLTSRLLEQPMNEGIIAPSAAGKNHAVDVVLPFFPAEAYFVVDAGSPRSLIYNNEDLRHRIVIFSEADSIPKDDSTAASALRTLATKQQLIYDVVERDEETGHWVTRRIVRQGPTGLITTSTKPFDDQWNTRMLQFGVDDTEEQTRLVLIAHAASVNGAQPKVDISSLLALQTWLALAGDHEVTVPFGATLAKLVPAGHVRMRRDFRQMLTAVQSVALLHQSQRERDKHGRIVATLDDYRKARELLLDAFTQAATGGVSPAVREVVAAVIEVGREQSGPATKKQIADKIGLSTAGAWYRLVKALDLGYVVNQETRARQPAKLVVGEPLPEEKPALPTAEEIAMYIEGDHSPGDDRNAETVPERQTQSASEPADSMADSVPCETVVESVLEAESDSKSADEQPPLQRFSDSGLVNPFIPIEDDTLHERILILAAKIHWAAVTIGPAETITGTEEGWKKFTSMATDDRLQRALEALEAAP